MKQEQLKKLAEWYYDKKIYYDVETNKAFRANIGEERIYVGDWQPHKDSNQLDMLEDKMIEEAKIMQISIYLYEAKKIEVHYVIEGRFICGAGKTKNEARLDAILNYIENK